MFQKEGHHPRPLCSTVHNHAYHYSVPTTSHNHSRPRQESDGQESASVHPASSCNRQFASIFRRELNAWCQLTAGGLKWCSAFWVTEGHCVKWNNIILDPSKISIPVRKSLWITVETGISCYFMSVSSWPSMLTLFSLNISLRWCANMCKWDRMSVLVKNWPFVSNPTL